ncbi:MAG: hypothetical protein ACLQU5_32700 [Isosphaeraceae bacterium]
MLLGPLPQFRCEIRRIATLQELQRRLVAAGLLSEIKPPPRFMPSREPFTPVAIEGEPLSETIIRERR